MSTSKLEYIWLDGFKPTQGLRSKTRIAKNFGGKLEDCPMWNFDGSSTQQAEGNASDCLLKPVALFPDPQKKNGYLVMTEVLNADGTDQPSVFPFVTAGYLLWPLSRAFMRPEAAPASVPRRRQILPLALAAASVLLGLAAAPLYELLQVGRPLSAAEGLQ